MDSVQNRSRTPYERNRTNDQKRDGGRRLALLNLLCPLSGRVVPMFAPFAPDEDHVKKCPQLTISGSLASFLCALNRMMSLFSLSEVLRLHYRIHRVA